MQKTRVIAKINEGNSLGISPFGAVFWNMEDKGRDFSDIIILMLKAGANPDSVMPFKPISYLQSGYTINTKNITVFEDIDGMVKMTPLICSLVHRDEDTIALLLKNDYKTCDVNQADEEGMTPLMHAVKTNDMKITMQLLYNSGAKRNHTTDVPDVLTPLLDVNATDGNGYNAINHIIELDINGPIRCTFDNPKLLELLLTVGVRLKSIIDPDGNSKTASDIAKEVGATKLLQKIGGTILSKSASNAAARYAATAKGVEAPPVNDGIDWGNDGFNYDVKEDARKMLKRLELEAAKEREKALKEGRNPDSLDVMEVAGTNGHCSANR